MKKSILAVLAACTACAAAVGFSGCKSCGDGESLSDYDNIQSLLGKSYSQIVLTVTDTFGEDGSLVSEYTLNYGETDVTVEYRVEEFGALSLDTANPQFKTVKEGSVVIKDGVVVQQNGDSTVFSFDMISAGGLNFKEEYFSNVTVNSIVFRADVINPSGFFGVTVAGSNMKINAIYSDYLAEMIITYTSAGGHSVEYEYNFTAKF